MRICFFGYMNISKKEGASLSLLNVMEEIANRGHEVYFVAAGKEIIPQMENKGINCITLLSYTMRQDKDETGVRAAIKYMIKDIVNRAAVIRGERKLRNYDFDVVHINGIDNHVGAAIAASLKIPYFWHIRQFLQEDLGKRIVREKIVMKYMYNADGVIGISKAVQNKFETILKRPVRVIYNGIPLNNYRLGEVSRFCGHQVRMLLAGRITENKGQLEAVKAVGILKKKGVRNIRLTLAGNAEPEYMKKVQQAMKEDCLEDNITILDYCDDLRDLWRNSDIGLICSKNEAFGRVTVEYMCAEMLVIGADRGGTAELISEGETGLLYQQGYADSLAEKIEYAVHHPDEMKKIAKKGRDYAFQSFSIERVCDEILDFYAHPYKAIQ